MRLLVTGGAGQLGRTVARVARNAGHEVIAASREELDITKPLAMAFASGQPEAVINAAAFTSVDGAETKQELAFAVNGVAAGALASECAMRAVPLIHISTDYVFEGSEQPLAETDPTSPINLYGASKLDGERRVIARGGCVVRTSWLFATGGHGFVQSIVAAARKGSVLRVVDDQRGCPTWADDLAIALLALLALPDRPSLVHYRGDPVVSRYEFAKAIVEELGVDIAIEPIRSPVTPARRPTCTILDVHRAESLGLAIRSWRRGLRETL